MTGNLKIRPYWNFPVEDHRIFPAAAQEEQIAFYPVFFGFANLSFVVFQEGNKESKNVDAH